MNHPHLPALRYHSRREPRSLKALLLLAAAGIFLALSSCNDESTAQPPPVVVSMEPVGSGLTLLAFGLVGGAVVLALGKLLK
jgi:hypothetical protein